MRHSWEVAFDNMPEAGFVFYERLYDLVLAMNAAMTVLSLDSKVLILALSRLVFITLKSCSSLILR